MFINDVKILNLLDDLSCLEEVSSLIWEEWSKQNNAKLADVIYRSRHSLNYSDIPQMYIAKFEDKVIGVVSLWRNDLAARQDLFPWMATLFVKKEYRNKGVGTKLQERCIEEARKLNFKSLYLITDHKDYYEKMGWEFLEAAPLGNGLYTRIYEYKL